MLQAISAEMTLPLRQQILRPHQTLSSCIYPLDYEPDSYHLGYFQKKELLGIGSIHREPLPDSADHHTWRLRGMAVSETLRGQGIGGQILLGLLQYVAHQSCPGTVWCNGRLPAASFYQRYGFTVIGEVFEIPQLGPHLRLVRSFTEQDR